MREQTARDKAEILVALIKAQYPKPSMYSEVARPRDSSTFWYCVGSAYERFIHDNPDMRPPKGHNEFGWIEPHGYIPLNNAGRFDEAWDALTDAIAQGYRE